MSSRLYVACGAALLLALPPALHAQSEISSEPLAANRKAAMLDEVVVTATRGAQALEDVASRVEVVNEETLAQTPGNYLLDALKKNASIDIIQYPGGLAGVGLRGFRPEFSGSNKRVLTLVDGRPAGVTNLGNLGRAGVIRVEVLKGSASALYGASAMGGVVNFITRDSAGDRSGELGIGVGSYEAVSGTARIGGDIAPGWDFDLAYDERSQFEDYQLGKQSQTLPGGFVQGGGVTRPNTSFQNRSGYGRLGWDVAPDWRVDARVHSFLGRDINSPGAESDRIGNQATKDVDTLAGDMSLIGLLGTHQVRVTAFATREEEVSYIEPVNTSDSLQSMRDTRSTGLQLQDTVDLGNYGLIFGIDYERVTNDNRSFNPNGSQRGAFSPNDERLTYAAYLEGSARWFEKRLIVNLGGRYDRIENTLLATPLRPDLVLGSASFNTFNPRIGVVFTPQADGPIRLHASAGEGFVSPNSNQVAGLTDQLVGNQRRIARGNPDLRPESSRSFDFGVGYESTLWGADLTWFRTEVEDRIESIFISNTATLRETTSVNASSSLAQGYEAVLQADVGALWGASPRAWTLEQSATYYTNREQLLPTGPSPLRNVARLKLNTSLAFDGARWGIRIASRYNKGAIDQDFSLARVFTNGAGGLFEYPSFVLWDIDARWRVTQSQQLSLQIENLFDRYYFEKNDFPFAGRTLLMRYRYQF